MTKQTITCKYCGKTSKLGTSPRATMSAYLSCGHCGYEMPVEIRGNKIVMCVV